MEKGWDARGLLAEHWEKIGGRDRLAELTQIQPATLSGYNTGRLSLGVTNARRIAAVLGVSLAELGAPEEAAADDPRSKPLLVRLAELEGRVSELEGQRDALLSEILGRLDSLEAAVQSGGRRGSRRSTGEPGAR